MLTTADMQDFIRGYDRAMEWITNRQRMASTELGSKLIRSLAVNISDSYWHREGARMALAECEENWRRAQLLVGPYRRPIHRADL